MTKASAQDELLETSESSTDEDAQNEARASTPDSADNGNAEPSPLELFKRDRVEGMAEEEQNEPEDDPDESEDDPEDDEATDDDPDSGDEGDPDTEEEDEDEEDEQQTPEEIDDVEEDEDDFIEEEQFKQLSRKTQKRIKRLNRENKQLKPAAQLGQAVSKFAQDHQMAMEEVDFFLGLAGLAKAQSPEALQYLDNMAANIRATNGIADPVTGLAPSEEPLTAGEQELIDLYEIPEADVRLLKAAKALQAGAPAPAPQAPPQPAPAAPQPQQPPTPQPNAAEEAAVNGRIVAWLEGKGVKDPTTEVQTVLAPHLVQYSSNGTLAGIPLALREDAVKLAYDKAHQSAPATPPRRVKDRPVGGRRGKGAPSPKTKSKDESPLKKFIRERVES